MVVDKILNNNIISSFDESGREILLAGRGIGWHAKPGQAVDRSKIVKIFRMDSPDSTSRLKQLLLEVDLEAVRAATKIVEYARETLEKKLNKNLYITLTDHISFAAERMKSGLTFHNMLSLETRKLYPREYAVGLHGLQIIQESMSVSLPETEATSSLCISSMPNMTAIWRKQRGFFKSYKAPSISCATGCVPALTKNRWTTRDL